MLTELQPCLPQFLTDIDLNKLRQQHRCRESFVSDGLPYLAKLRDGLLVAKLRNAR